jgi:hypothetical protein
MTNKRSALISEPIGASVGECGAEPRTNGRFNPVTDSEAVLLRSRIEVLRRKLLSLYRRDPALEARTEKKFLKEAGAR